MKTLLQRAIIVPVVVLFLTIFSGYNGVFWGLENTVVPEPSTFLLLGSGLAALGVWRWREAKGSKS